MNNQELNEFEMLELAQLAEMELSKYYAACSTCCEPFKSFWLKMSDCEKKHAEDIARIKNLLRNAPDEYFIQIRILPQDLRAFIEKIRVSKTKVLEQRTNCCICQKIALHLEDSINEMQYYHLVESANEDYRAYVADMKAEVLEHRELLESLKCHTCGKFSGNVRDTQR